MFSCENNKTQRHPHFTESPPRFINEMEKVQSKNRTDLCTEQSKLM